MIGARSRLIAAAESQSAGAMVRVFAGDLAQLLGLALEPAGVNGEMRIVRSSDAAERAAQCEHEIGPAQPFTSDSRARRIGPC